MYVLLNLLIRTLSTSYWPNRILMMLKTMYVSVISLTIAAQLRGNVQVEYILP